MFPMFAAVAPLVLFAFVLEVPPATAVVPVAPRRADAVVFASDGAAVPALSDGGAGGVAAAEDDESK